MTRICDHLFTGGLLLLILATPFAFGAVQAWAYTAMEVVIFALVIVWMAKRAVTRGQRSEVGDQWSPNTGHLTPNTRERLMPLALPLALFIALCAMQLIPLPPSLLKVISPSTFEVYKQSLPGWPESAPYAELLSMEQGAGSAEPEQSANARSQTSDVSNAADAERDNAMDAKNATNANDQRSAVGEEQGAGSGEAVLGVGYKVLGSGVPATQPPGGTAQSAIRKPLPLTPLPLAVEKNAINATNAERNNARDATDATNASEDVRGEGLGVRGNPQNAKNATNAINGEPSTEHPTPGTESASRLTPYASRLGVPQTWLPLSISAGLTRIDLLKFAAFAALFFLVWRYPFEKPFEDFEIHNSQSAFFILSLEQRFLRSVVFAVLGTGLLVAAFGFIERFAWNGNILLFVAGYESGAPAADTVARASGPFINPDHFANYLSLIFPLALGCALFRTFMVPKANEYGLKIFCGFTTFLLFTGILLSLSRGAWVNALFAVVVLVWLAPWGAGARQSAKRKGPSGRTVRSEVSGVRSNAKNSTNAERNNAKSRLARFARLSAVTVCVLLIVSLFFAGQSGREQVDVRLSDTIEQTDLGLGARVTVILKDIPKMIMDFPLFGVGLGAWPELFLRYRSGPWSTIFFREAHNDYLEILAETGLVGAGLLAGFFFVAGRRLVRGLRKSSSKYLPLIAAILAALGGMAVHEWLDFSLQIPANAFLFTVLLAVGLRLATGQMSEARNQRSGSMEQNLTPNTQYLRPEISLEQGAWSSEGDQRSQVGDVRSEALGVRRRDARNPMNAINAISARMTPYAGLVAAAVLLICALLQDQSAYPYNLREMTSLAEAQELLLRHPTHSPYHLSVVKLAGENAPVEWQLVEAKAALWNEPVNPSYRDFYAATLMAMDKTEEGLKEVTRSVTESPSLGTHAYLAPENLPLLSDEEQAAVEQGFRQALSQSYPEALAALSEFYAKLERFADQAALYEQAAVKETDPARKSDLLISAALGYVKAASEGQRAKGEEQSTKRAAGVRGNPENAKNAINATNAERNNALNAPPHASRLTPHGVSAERLFRAAIAVNPSDPKPYHQLLTAVFATRKDLDGAKELVGDGLKSGAPALPLYLSLAEAAHKTGDPDEREAALESAKAEVDKLIKSGESPYTLYIALADGARRAGDRDQESAALLKALDRQPRAPETLLRLANVYLEKRNFDRASMYLNRVAGITPNSADLFYRIAQTEEARYRFAAAGRAYARALELAPNNAGYRERYAAFMDRVARSREFTFDKSP